MKKVAVFVDWENLRKDIEAIQKRTQNGKKFNYNSPAHLTKLFQSYLKEDEEFYRIFFYSAMPRTAKEIKDDLKTHEEKERYELFLQKKYANGRSNQEKFSQIYKASKKLLDGIIFEPYVALRLGELQVRGLDANHCPIVGQKQVDMLLGLDVSHVAYMKLVDTILLFCKDSDMTPVLKTARINGLTTILANIEGGFKITTKLKKHCDITRTRKFEEFLEDLKG